VGIFYPAFSNQHTKFAQTCNLKAFFMNTTINTTNKHTHARTIQDVALIIYR